MTYPLTASISDEQKERIKNLKACLRPAMTIRDGRLSVDCFRCDSEYAMRQRNDVWKCESCGAVLYDNTVKFDALLDPNMVCNAKIVTKKKS